MKLSRIIPALVASITIFGSSAASAASIIFAGGTPDANWNNLLVTTGGHTVDLYSGGTNPNASELSLLNGYDLVIIGSSFSAGNNFNNVTTSLILMNPYRADDMGWGTANPGTGSHVNSSSSIANVIDPTSSIWDGISLSGSQTASGVFNNIRTTQSSSITGTTIATGTNGRLAIGLLNEAGIADGPRMFFAGHNSGSTVYPFTGEGGQMFLNAVDLMTIPEPSSIGLLGLGGLVLMLRRRRS